MKNLSPNQESALRVVLAGDVVRDQPLFDAAEHWHVLSGEKLSNRTMDSLYARGYIALEKDRSETPRFWRRLVSLTRDGRMALGLPGVDLDEARMRLGLYLIQHDIRAAGTSQSRPSDIIHSMVRTENGREVEVQLRASDIERVIDGLDGHL